MNLTNPEAIFLAKRLYGLEIVLRGMLQANPAMAAHVGDFVDKLEGLALYDATPGLKLDESIEYAKKVVRVSQGQAG